MGLLSTLSGAVEAVFPSRFTTETLARADNQTVLFPPVSGDVAQVSNLPLSIAQAFGINLDADSVSRKQAMTIPAMRRGRQVIAGTLGTAPLICVRRIKGQPPERVDRPFFKQPDPNVTRAYMLTWTIDDLLFYGHSFWYVTSRDADMKPLTGFRVPLYRITPDHVNGKILIDGNPQTIQANLIRFDGPDEGVLVHGATALKTSLLLEEAVRRYARLDVPLGFLKDLGDGTLEDNEITDILDEWELARTSRTTAYLPKDLDYQSAMFNAQQLQLSEARQHQAGEVARLLNLPPNAVNAPSNDSLTYATTESNRRELVDLTYAPFIAAIEQRLSMNDVSPNGTEVYVDLSKFLRGDTKNVVETGALAVSSGLMTKDEVRTEWLNLPPLKESTDGQ